MQHRESNLTTMMLQDIPTFDGQDSPKLEDWLMDIETATGILTESHFPGRDKITWPHPHAHL